MTCKKGWILRINWYNEQSPGSKRAYEKHVKACPDCRPDFAAMEKAVLAWEYDDEAIARAAAERGVIPMEDVR